ncbi:hypothetical protein TWF730_007787 [Orbilia blumenaviensis]|uniref:holo-[acyl-carrier-protein] synthase n=1 Tax=Orbilia blumenaviensis TaxID=1796055 RepID=A0AAV9VBK7_9PEZI
MPLIRWLLNVAPLWNTPEEFNEALNHLPATTHEHILKFHRSNDRKLALGSQILQHLIVCKHRNIPFRDVRIVRNFGGIPGGRPVFTGDNNRVEGLEYNVSHHGSVVGIISRLLPPKEGGKEDEGGGVGVDILEYEKRPHYVDGTLEAVREWAEGFKEGKVFTGREMGVIDASTAAWEGMDEEDKMRGVVKAVHLNWVVKEAYVKAVGTGLVTDLTAVEFGLVGVGEGIDCGERMSDFEVWVGGRQRRMATEWYFEVEKVVKDGLEGPYCVGIVTRAEGLEEGDKSGVWEWLEYEGGILPLIRSSS